MSRLRADLLEGRAVALAGGVPDQVARALTALGARVEILGDPGPPEDGQAGQWGEEHGPLDALVYDAGRSFGGGGAPALDDVMQKAWMVVREVAVGALIGSSSAGKIVLLGPGREAGPYAEAAQAALESLARTLSVEWARYGITAVMVAPSVVTGGDVLTELVCFLCSAGGEYLSGCRLELDQAGASAQGTTTASS